MIDRLDHDPRTVEVAAIKFHRNQDGDLVDAPARYFTSMKRAAYLSSIRCVRIVDAEDAASDVRVVETKEGAKVETSAAPIAVAKEAAPKHVSKGKGRR